MTMFSKNTQNVLTILTILIILYGVYKYKVLFGLREGGRGRPLARKGGPPPSPHAFNKKLNAATKTNRKKRRRGG
jgi:hypothetical protein